MRDFISELLTIVMFIFGTVRSLLVYIIILTLLTIFLLRGGQKILACWWRQPVGVGVCVFALVLLLEIPQMPDMFFGMAMGFSDGKADWHAWHAFGLGAAATWLSLEAWYWTRAGLLSHLRVTDTLWLRSAQRDGTGAAVVIEPPAIAPDFDVVWAARWVMICSGGVAAAPLLLYLSGRLPDGEFTVIARPVLFGLVTLVIACLLVINRNRLISASLLASSDVRPNSNIWRYNTTSLFAAAPFGWRVAICIFLLSIAARAIVAHRPDLIEAHLHAPTAAVLALSFLIAPLTVLLAISRDIMKMFFLRIQLLYLAIVNWCRRKRGRQPVSLQMPDIDGVARTAGLFLLLVWATLNDAFNDTGQTLDKQYLIRPAGKAAAAKELVAERNSLSAALDSWRKQFEEEKEGPIPLIIVAVEGGASRSAAWLLSVLRTLDETTDGQFGRHIFAFSAVSGGSLGAATYVEMLKSGNWSSQMDFWNDKRTKNGMRELARGDLLAASIATFFLNDAVSRLIGFWDSDDRGVALERAFERHWQWPIGFSILKPQTQQGFLSIRKGNTTLPHLMLNGTEVQTGRRAITSSIAFKPQDDLFAAADDLLSRLQYDVPMLTAVTNSARFPFVSPAGRFGKKDTTRDDRAQIVDGGVFENYGARTAWELARGVNRLGKSIMPIVVLVSNDADGAPSREDRKYNSVSKLRLLEETAISCELRVGDFPELTSLNVEAQRREKSEGSALLPDSLTSAIGLYASRGAHGRGELFTLKREFCSNSSFFHIALPAPIVEKHQAAPMNWVLNVDVCRFLFGEALTAEFNRRQIRGLVQKLEDLGIYLGESDAALNMVGKRHADECY